MASEKNFSFLSIYSKTLHKKTKTHKSFQDLLFQSWLKTGDRLAKIGKCLPNDHLDCFFTFSACFYLTAWPVASWLTLITWKEKNDRKTGKMFILLAYFYIHCLNSGRNRCKLGAHKFGHYFKWQLSSDHQKSLVFADFPWIYIRLQLPENSSRLMDLNAPAQTQSQSLYLWLWTSGSAVKSIIAINENEI